MKTRVVEVLEEKILPHLVEAVTEQKDQDFIDDLIASGDTHQTKLYSILWSPYKAGRVLKDKVGNVRAICVINARS